MGASSGGGQGLISTVGNMANAGVAAGNNLVRQGQPQITTPRYGNYGQFSGSDVTGMVRQNMGNYGNMVNQLQQGGVGRERTYSPFHDGRIPWSGLHPCIGGCLLCRLKVRRSGHPLES